MRVEELLNITRRVVSEYALCDSCLGRLFGMLGHGLTNAERGHALKTVLLMDSYNSVEGTSDETMLQRLAATGFKPAEEALARLGKRLQSKAVCEICGGIMERLDELSLICVEAGKEYEYETFQVGCSLPGELIRREEELWLKFGIASSESIKSELSREIGKRISKLTGKEYSLKDPDVVFVVSVPKWSVKVSARPIYIYGRYRKLARGLPQSPWLYKPDSRVLYPFSIEELITKPPMELSRGDGAKLHAAGREDLDVRTLGSGRPFIAEVRNPRIRRINLREVERLINERARGLVEVEGLRYVDGRLVPKLKAYAEIARKTYVAKIRVDKDLNLEDLEKLERELSGAIVSQKTPLRVLGRKPERARKKVVYEVKAKFIDSRTLELVITCQGGLYVKELIHGDEGRTRPSVAEILGARVEVEELDVTYVEEPAIVTQYFR